MKYKNIKNLETYEEIMLNRAHKKWNKLSDVEKAFEKLQDTELFRTINPKPIIRPKSAWVNGKPTLRTRYAKLP